MDVMNSIALASMEMASARVSTEMKVAALRSAIDMKQDSLAILMSSLGVGQNLNISA